MVDILKQFHSYLPQTGDQGVDGQLFSGDQLTVERAVNVIASVAKNGLTPKDGLEGINMQLGDWHAAVKLLTVSKILFTYSCSQEQVIKDHMKCLGVKCNPLSNL